MTGAADGSRRRGRGAVAGWLVLAALSAAGACAPQRPGSTGVGTQSAPAVPGIVGAAAPDDLMEPAPELFRSEAWALWDGRRTLGGVWVATFGTGTARRVRITNEETGAIVDGALLPQQAWYSGPELEISAQAAVALGLTPGIPVAVEIVALVDPRSAREGRTASASDDPAAHPDSGIPPGSGQPGALPSAPGGAGPTIADGLPYIEAGAFFKTSNAQDLAEGLQRAGLPAFDAPATGGGGLFRRVLVGPFQSIYDRNRALDIARGMGAAQAHPVRE